MGTAFVSIVVVPFVKGGVEKRIHEIETSLFDDYEVTICGRRFWHGHREVDHPIAIAAHVLLGRIRVGYTRTPDVVVLGLDAAWKRPRCSVVRRLLSVGRRECICPGVTVHAEYLDGDFVKRVGSRNQSGGSGAEILRIDYFVSADDRGGGRLACLLADDVNCKLVALADDGVCIRVLECALCFALVT
jgi:hypothetical protein